MVLHRNLINRDPDPNGSGGTGNITLDNISFEQTSANPNPQNPPPPNPPNTPTPNPVIPFLNKNNQTPNPQNPVTPPATPNPQNQTPANPTTPVTDETAIELDGLEYKLDKDGNAVGADGKVFKTKVELDEIRNTQPEEKLVDTIIKKYGTVPIDDKGQPKVYEDTEDGVIQLSNDIAELKTTEERSKFFKRYPAAAEIARVIDQGGDLREYYQKQLSSWSTRKFDATNVDDCNSAIIDDLVAKGSSKEDATEIAKVWKDKGDDVFKQKGQAARDSRVAAEANAKLTAQKLDEQAELEENQRWNDFWIHTQKTIKEGKLRDVIIPDTDRDSFFNFISADTGNGMSALQLKKQELAQKSPDVLLQLDYLLFKDFNLDKLVRNTAETKKVVTLREKLRTQKQPVNNGNTPATPQKFSQNIPTLTDVVNQ